MSRSQNGSPPKDPTKGLPTDVAAEAMILGQVLLDSPTHLSAVRGQLQTDDFSLEKHKRIFRAACALRDRGLIADRLAVADELTSRGELESCDGLAYLCELDGHTPGLPNLDGYIRIVKGKADLRRIIAQADLTMKQAACGEYLAEELIDSGGVAYKRLAESIAAQRAPEVLGYDDLITLKQPETKHIFEGFPLPARGAVLKVGAPKTGKTVLTVQTAVAIASGKPLLDNYRVLVTGPAMIIEQDDPDGKYSIADILQRSWKGGPIPVFVVPKVSFSFGPAFIDWLEKEIDDRSLKFVAIDSYTALRGLRNTGVDIVKAEQNELRMLDELAKSKNVALDVLHHESRTGAARHWTQRGGGTFAMTGATEAQIHMARFGDEEGGNERLIRVQGRRARDVHMVLRFREETLSYEFLYEGFAAELFPQLEQLHHLFGERSFTAPELVQQTGVARATGYRHLDRLRKAGAVYRAGGDFGVYALSPEVVRIWKP
jgi:DnaB-like helicase N terminal domain/AAA domain